MTNIEYVRQVLSKQFKLLDEGLGQSETIARMAAIIEAVHIDKTKTISIVGGAASSKSTIAEELVAFMQKDDQRTDMLCTDNYVKGDREYRQVTLKDADAKYKYDATLLDQHIKQIRNLQPGETVKVPTLNKDTGVAVDGAASNYDYEIGPLDNLIVEGDFPRDDYDVRFYIDVPDEQRLQNNIDRETKNDDSVEPGQLTENFNDRQRTLHKPYTLPALETAQYVIATDATGDDWQYAIYKKVG